MPWPDEEIQWTPEEVLAIKNAVLKKAKGERLTAVDLGGRVEQYADATLDQLRGLLDSMIAETGASAPTRPRIFRSRYSKGL